MGKTTHVFYFDHVSNLHQRYAKRRKWLTDLVCPVLLIGKIFIERNAGVLELENGLSFLFGPCRKTSGEIACTFFVKTTKTLAEKIHGPKYRFGWKGINKNMVWAYRKII